MKQVFAIAWLFVNFTFCSKKKESAPVPLVSRVTANGGIAYKFFYNDSRQLSRWEIYAYESPGSPLSAQFEFTYNENGLLAQLATFSEPGKVPVQRLVFLEDMAKKRLSGFEAYELQGGNPAIPSRKANFNYNAAGRLSTVVIRNKDGELELQYNLSYFDDGTLKQRDGYDESVTNQLRLRERTIYSLPIPSAGAGWESVAAIPLDGPEISRTVHYDGIQRYVYNNGVLQTHRGEVISAREYNADGTIKRHGYTRKNIVPAAPDVASFWEFEYVQQ